MIELGNKVDIEEIKGLVIQAVMPIVEVIGKKAKESDPNIHQSDEENLVIAQNLVIMVALCFMKQGMEEMIKEDIIKHASTI